MNQNTRIWKIIKFGGYLLQAMNENGACWEDGKNKHKKGYVHIGILTGKAGELMYQIY